MASPPGGGDGAAGSADQLEELRVRLIKATKDGLHKHWFTENGVIKSSGTVTDHEVFV